MEKRILYIIGNGFDLHHEIESSYFDFQNYVEKEDMHLLLIANEYILNSVDEWNDFENSLGVVDPNHIIDIVSGEHLDFDKEDFSERDIHRFNDTINYDMEALIDGFDSEFQKWVEKIEIPKRKFVIELLLPLKVDSTFITFNYTNTLETIYKIPTNNILHIHGEIDNPIYGHGEEKMTEFTGDEWSPTDEALDKIEFFFKSTKKDVLSIINSNKDFFSSLKSIDEVHVIGHSLNNIDLPYFKKIKESISPKAKWVVTYYKKSKELEPLEQLRKIGINDKLIEQIFIDIYQESF